MPFADHEVGTGTRSALFATLSACGMLILISCANLTNLLLARNTQRRAEFAVRATLGATPRHLVGQLLAENCALAIVAASLGLLLSGLLVRAAQELKVVHLARLGQASLNFPALAFVAAVTLLVAIMLTIVPAMRSLRPALLTDLSNGSARTSGSKGLRQFSMQIALAFGALALALAVFGTYGLLAYEVSLREREMGIRLALGSSRGSIVTLLLRQESRWIAGGIFSGLLTAAAVGFVLRAQFFHAGATSVPVLITSSLLLAVPALLAVAVPGRRASLLEPAITLRRE